MGGTWLFIVDCTVVTKIYYNSVYAYGSSPIREQIKCYIIYNKCDYYIDITDILYKKYPR